MALITTQDGASFISSRISAVTVHYWPQLKEGDPDVSYDVMIIHMNGTDVGGRFSTLARANEVKVECANAADQNLEYEVPAS